MSRAQANSRANLLVAETYVDLPVIPQTQPVSRPPSAHLRCARSWHLFGQNSRIRGYSCYEGECIAAHTLAITENSLGSLACSLLIAANRVGGRHQQLDHRFDCYPQLVLYPQIVSQAA